MKKYVILCNPLHDGKLCILTRLNALGAQTCGTGRDIADGILYGDFLSAVEAYQLCMWFDERYHPWISPFIAEVENGRITAAIVSAELLDEFSREKWVRDVLDPIGVGIRGRSKGVVISANRR